MRVAKTRAAPDTWTKETILVKKKVFAAMIATLVMVMTFSVSALAISVSGPQSVETGQVVTLTIDGGNVDGVTGDITTSGLELISYSGGLSDETSILLLADLGGMTGTYTYRVTAQAGQNASFTISNVMEAVNDVDTPAAGAQWTARVGAATDASPSPTTSPSDTPTDQPSQPASEEPSTVPTESPSNGGQSPQQTQTPAPAPSDQQGQNQTPTPAPSGYTPPAGGNAGGTTGGTNGGGTTGGTTTSGGGNLPKTADSTTNMWLFACLTAAVGTVAIIAARKCSIRGEAQDEQ